ncbi:MAG: terminase large subunit domain-containing protein [Egibacteraceae bacterium]
MWGSRSVVRNRHDYTDHDVYDYDTYLAERRAALRPLPLVSRTTRLPEGAVVDLRAAAEAAELLVKRREEDGLLAFVEGDPGPFPHQVKLWESTKSEAWLFGANRSGKTKALMARRAARLRFGNPDPRGAYGNGITIYDRAVKSWTVSLKHDMNRNNVQPVLFNNGAGIESGRPFIPQSEIASWNITNQTLRLKNGSVGIFKSCDQGRDAFMGAEIDDVDFDEVPHKEVYKEVTLRVGGGKSLVIRGAATILPPPGEPGGVTWMYSEKVKPWLEGGRNDSNFDIFTASIYDNPTILPSEIARLESQFPPGSPEYLIRLKGMLLPTIGGALVYGGSFTRGFHMNPALAPRDRDGHPRPNVHPHIPLVLAIDFNATNGVWLVGQKVNRMFRVLDEIALERSDVAAMAYEFRSRFPAHSAELWVYGDATGRRRDGQTGEASFYLVQEYLQNYPCPIRFIIPEVNPPVKDRVSAVNRVLRPGDGSKMVDVAAHCDHLAHDLETTKWRANGTVDKSDPGEQSNAADALGYWIVGDSPVPRYASSSAHLKSIRGPRYTAAASGAVFPAGVTHVPTSRPVVKIGGRYFGAPRHA